MATALTMLCTLILKAAQPADWATTLLVSLGSMQSQRDYLVIKAWGLIIATIGELLRRFRFKQTVLRPESLDFVFPFELRDI